MESLHIAENIEVVFLKASNFPHDVPATYERLHALIPDDANRRYFGISHPDKTGAIQYKAAAEILPTEDVTNTELQRFTIEKGNFSGIYIVNHFQDSNCIGAAFQELLKQPQLDPNGYCLEVYKNYTDLDVHCMVRIIP